MATNVNVRAQILYPQAGADLKGRRLALIDSVAKAAQNDTVTVTNASSVATIQVLSAINDATGEWESHTVSNNVITLTSATTGAKTLMVLIKE